LILLREENQMPLSSKLQADYTELANQYLDHIAPESRDPLESRKQVRAITAALSVLLPQQNQPSDRTAESKNQAPTSTVAPHSLSTQQNQPSDLGPSLQGRIESVRELLDNPGIFVEQEKDFEAFKSIVLARVKSRIGELEAMSQKNIEEQCEEQDKAKKSAEDFRARIAQVAPPAEGSATHVVSEEEAIAIHWGWSLQHVDEEAQQDEAPTWGFASHALQNNREIVLAAVQQRHLWITGYDADGNWH
jgi:hypothetical protein